MEKASDYWTKESPIKETDMKWKIRLILFIVQCHLDNMYKNVLKYLEFLRTIYGNDVNFICGYEAEGI